MIKFTYTYRPALKKGLFSSGINVLYLVVSGTFSRIMYKINKLFVILTR